MREDSSDFSFGIDKKDQSILDHLSDLISVVDKEFVYRAVSKGYSQLFGKESSEIIGMHVAELHGEEVFNQALKPALEQALNGKDIEFQFSRPGPDSSRVHIHSKHTRYNGPLTAGPGVAIVARDISELVGTTEALRKERELLSNIINTLPDFVFAKDQAGVYQVVNRSFEEFLDMSADTIIGKTDSEIMSQASAEHILKMDNQVKLSGKELRYDEWVTYADGRQRLMDMHKLPLDYCEEGKTGILGIGSNVTFERQAEQSREVASLFFELTTNPCFVLSRNAKILHANEAARKHFGIPDENPGTLLDYLFFVSAQATDLSKLTANKGYWNGELSGNDDITLTAALHQASGRDRNSSKFVLIIQSPADHNGATKDLLSKAYEDPLTQLPNRRLFISKLESAIIRAERQLRKLAVLYIDLNSMKQINDSLGHKAGDEVLITLARILPACLRATDTLARIGGDEFAALIDIDKESDADSVVSKIHLALEQSVHIEELSGYCISASIGVSYFPVDGDTAESLLHKADLEMYAAKRIFYAKKE